MRDPHLAGHPFPHELSTILTMLRSFSVYHQQKNERKEKTDHERRDEHHGGTHAMPHPFSSKLACMCEFTLCKRDLESLSLTQAFEIFSFIQGGWEFVHVGLFLVLVVCSSGKKPMLLFLHLHEVAC